MRSASVLSVVLLSSCMTYPATTVRVARPVADAPRAASTCTAEGSWLNTTPDVGRSTITVARGPDGRLTASEDGMATFEGIARFGRGVLRIDFRTAAGYAGWYEWVLDGSCNAGRGRLVFTALGQGEHASSITRVL